MSRTSWVLLPLLVALQQQPPIQPPPQPESPVPATRLMTRHARVGTPWQTPDIWLGFAYIPLSAQARAALRPGKNVISVHTHQTRGGQFIDVGIVDVIEK